LPFTALVLVGGKSLRMGRNKGYLELGGKRVIDWVLECFIGLAGEIIIVGSKEKGSNIDMPYVKDEYPGAGPLAGIHAGLKKAKYGKVFVAAWDMPFITPELVRYLVDQLNDFDAVVPLFREKLQPLCAVYNKRCITYIEDSLKNGNNRVTSFLKSVRAKYIEEIEIKKIASPDVVFFNINTPGDYDKAVRLLSGLSQ